MATNSPSPVEFKQLTITEAELFGTQLEEEDSSEILKETSKEVKLLLKGKENLLEDIFPVLDDKLDADTLPQLLTEYSNFLVKEEERIGQLKQSCALLLTELEQIGQAIANIQKN